MPALRDRHWDAIVIGAGLGGLSAAAALTHRGLRVLVLEQHGVPGGYAHRFLRRPRGSNVTYRFDVALHQIGGLSPERRLARALLALGVRQRIRLRRFDRVYRTTGPSHDLDVSADAAAYQRQLGTLFPDHRPGIRDLFERLAAADLGVRGHDDPPAAATSLLGRSLREVVREHVSDERFLAVFSPLWAYLGLPPAQLCAFTFAQVWASYHLGGCYYVEGGGQGLADAFVATIEAGGGQVLLRAPVTQIVTTRGRAAGVAAGPHGSAFAPAVVSNASAPDTFARLLDRPSLIRAGRRDVGQAPAMSVSIVESYVGLKGRAEALGLGDRLLFTMPSYDLDAQWQALEHGHHTCVPAVLANHNLADPSSIPAHRSVVNAAVLTNGAPWMPLDDATYAERKREAEAHLCGQLRARIPSFDERVEVCETGTPRTMKRYSWNPAGAIYGTPASSRSHPLRRPRPRTEVPGLYLAGAWTFPAGGFHGAMISGLHTAALVANDLFGDPSAEGESPSDAVSIFGLASPGGRPLPLP